jgi:hypothetical protein
MSLSRILFKFVIILVLNFFEIDLLFASNEDGVYEKTQKDIDVKPKSKGKWLPVPIPISNPTVGSGLQVALLYLHPQTSDDPAVSNSTSGIGAMYTNTDSWFAGGFHDGTSRMI